MNICQHKNIISKYKENISQSLQEIPQTMLHVMCYSNEIEILDTF